MQDSMGTALNLREKRARDPVMHFINDILWSLQEVKQRKQYLMASHLDGLGNPAADMASRNMVQQMAVLAQALNLCEVRQAASA